MGTILTQIQIVCVTWRTNSGIPSSRIFRLHFSKFFGRFLFRSFRFRLFLFISRRKDGHSLPLVKLSTKVGASYVVCILFMSSVFNCLVVLTDYVGPDRRLFVLVRPKYRHSYPKGPVDYRCLLVCVLLVPPFSVVIKFKLDSQH